MSAYMRTIGAGMFDKGNSHLDLHFQSPTRELARSSIRLAMEDSHQFDLKYPRRVSCAVAANKALLAYLGTLRQISTRTLEAYWREGDEPEGLQAVAKLTLAYG